MKTFKELWTVENLEKIKWEFLSLKRIHLCNSSDLFKMIWNNFKSEVIQLAKKEFSANVGSDKDFCLFYCVSGDERNIRIRFLQSEIERLSKEEKTIQ